MNSSALIFMVIIQATVTIFTAMFFRKVLKTPKQPEPDSYTENDDES